MPVYAQGMSSLSRPDVFSPIQQRPDEGLPRMLFAAGLGITRRCVRLLSHEVSRRIGMGFALGALCHVAVMSDASRAELISNMMVIV